ncbi:flagellar basal body P-ring formation protein FlgA [Roseococcus sp. SYP-B2431]|uniref:flagellar basal body P-ring formation chaperone FlgA n=1 Tax=Roseococcus sp. SYP-B2431 TaxID=2496640 RepID=UPI0010391F83|nr:flagellar basal body P-ring formation chaperone FlgA [Roseococcus sp. SYP-B2431]TCH97180.1 flagellar basal body P-ring formation protein FlgA [Roseococcus sp. SYP-B2431]
MLRRSLFMLPALAAPALAAEPALLRPHALLEGDTLRLSDLFDPAPDTVIAAAPQPGRRMVLETQNLVNIARRYGVAWRPLTASDRIVVERPGRQLPRADIEAVLREALAPQGIDAEMEIELPGLIPPLIPAGSWFQLAVEGASVEVAGGRFQATLVVLAEGTGTQRLRVAGRAVATVPVVVATRRMALGEIVGRNDARLVRMRGERVRPGHAQQLEQVVGQELRRPMAAEQGFAVVDLGPPSIVQKNALVTLLLESPGIALTAQGRALEAAARGGTVPVMNLASRSIVEGVAVAPGRVRVAMGTIPMAAR